VTSGAACRQPRQPNDGAGLSGCGERSDETWEFRNRTHPIKAICCVIPVVTLCLALGCSPVNQHAATARSASKLLAEPPTLSAVVQKDASGITLTEHLPVTVTDGVRTDYETAVHMLDAAQYDQAIALLLKVTETGTDLDGSPYQSRHRILAYQATWITLRRACARPWT